LFQIIWYDKNEAIALLKSMNIVYFVVGFIIEFLLLVCGGCGRKH
jgi:hypothetical protein